jgi:hypothetical protein
MEFLAALKYSKFNPFLDFYVKKSPGNNFPAQFSTDFCEYLLSYN